MKFWPLVVALALPGLASAHADPAKLRFGQIPSTVHAVSSLYLFIAEKQGFFAAKTSRSRPCRFRAAPATWWRRWSAARST